ncbi:DUF4397 domain-containing protein [Halopiger goleimassiliensis]|uniref:DUF4397 domain-containing protein n=1 Tax=Halopiger goleimassiliensis TaxID=1293048 RepID=UPI000677E488|nr:DUF4397 domain-containing protein [Halopiger goleimassiliensis]
MTLSRRSTIKAIGVVGAGSTLSGTVLAVNQHEDDERDPEAVPDDAEMGAIRVAHFSPDAPEVDVYVDDDRILAGLGYDERSPYLEIVPGDYKVTITPADDPETVVYQRHISVDTEYYTAAAIGELEADEAHDEDDEDSPDAAHDEDHAAADDHGGDEMDDGADDDGDAAEPSDGPGTFELLFLVDRQPDAIEEDDTAHLRLVHAAPDAPTVEIADGETGTILFEDVSFTEPSGYAPVVAGERTLELYPYESDGDREGTDDRPEEADADYPGAVDVPDDVIRPEDPAASVDLDLEAGTVYTGYAIGYLEGRPDHDDVGEHEGDERDDDVGDRSFTVTLAIDGTNDADDDLEPETGDVEPDGDHEDREGHGDDREGHGDREGHDDDREGHDDDREGHGDRDAHGDRDVHDDDSDVGPDQPLTNEEGYEDGHGADSRGGS